MLQGIVAFDGHIIGISKKVIRKHSKEPCTIILERLSEHPNLAQIWSVLFLICAKFQSPCINHKTASKISISTLLLFFPSYGMMYYGNSLSIVYHSTTCILTISSLNTSFVSTERKKQWYNFMKKKFKRIKTRKDQPYGRVFCRRASSKAFIHENYNPDCKSGKTNMK